VGVLGTAFAATAAKWALRSLAIEPILAALTAENVTKWRLRKRANGSLVAEPIEARDSSKFTLVLTKMFRAYD